MPPTDPLQPLAGETPLSLEAGLVVLAVGVLVFLYLALKLYREWRAERESQE